MNTHIKITAFLLLLCTVLVSCSSGFLDIVPKGKQLAVTTNDYSLLMNSSAFYFYERSGGLQAPRWLGDEVSADAVDFAKNDVKAQRLFQWSDVIYVPTVTRDVAYDLTYGTANIFICNKIINEVMGSTQGTEAKKKAIKAEALATRAFEHFLLTNLYAKPYKAATATTDPGFPTIATSDITVTAYPRGTVQDDYDFIINDLTTAIADLPIQNTIRTRMSKPAAEGLLGKVYMFMGKYTEALPFLNAAFADIALSTDPPRLRDYNSAFIAASSTNTGIDAGAFLPFTTSTGPSKAPSNNSTDITESVLAKICYAGAYNGNGAGSDGLVLSPGTFNTLYGTTDFRRQFYSATYKSLATNPNGNLRKYSNGYTRFGLELSELYLLRAECKARLNDLAGAKADVEALRKCRMPVADATVPSATVADQTALIIFILNERIREFAGEGYRWFDMRRLSVDASTLSTALQATVNYTHTLYTGSGSTMTTTVYTLTPTRLTLQFPQTFVDSNPGMQNNP